MKQIQRHISGNLFGFYSRIARVCGYEAGRLAGCSYVWNRNGSWPSYMLGSPGKGRIQEVAAAVRKGDAPPFWIIENSSAAEIGLLEKEGFRVVREWKGMALERGDFRPVATGGSRPPGSLGIEVISNDPGTLKEWLQIVNTYLMTGAQLGMEIKDALLSDQSFRWMVAYLDGEPAGAGLSFEEGGVCGLYMIATVDSFRGRGVGTRITGELVSRALGSGSETIVLHATGQGERIYQNLGFREVNRLSIMWHLGG
jgi:GNAT superfamily N-acetyltransferase